MSETTEAALKGIGTAMKRERERHEVIFNIAKVGCEYRAMLGFPGEPIVYVCDKPGTEFGVLCCMRSCPHIKE